MITHNAYIWIKKEHQTSDDTAVMEAELNHLMASEHIAESSWGISAQTPERDVTDKSYNYGINLRFASVEDHNAFQSSPEHDRFVEQCAPMFDKVTVFDLEHKF